MPKTSGPAKSHFPTIWTIVAVCGVGGAIFLYASGTLLGIGIALADVIEASTQSGHILRYLLPLLMGVVFIAIAAVIIKVIVDRLKNGEDNYYSRNVDL